MKTQGGARPNAVVEDADGLWNAKFDRKDDQWDHARIERAMLRLAQACSIRAATSKRTTNYDREALLVKRFDWEKTDEGYRYARMPTALTVWRDDDEHPSDHAIIGTSSRLWIHP